MIKALLIDFGGVLTHSGDMHFFHRLGWEWIPFDELRSRWDKAKIGEITLDEYLAGVKSKKQFILDYHKKESLRKEAVVVLKELKKKYKLCLLSNHIPDLLVPYLKQKKLYSLFDVVLISGNGLCKPDKRFFELALKKLKVKANECAYLDDLLMSIGTANELGITTTRMDNGADMSVINARPKYKNIKPNYTVSSLKEFLELVNLLSKKEVAKKKRK